MPIRTILALAVAALPLGSALAAANIAPLGTASQSSTYSWPTTTADAAIDGNLNGSYYSGPFQHTQNDANNGFGTGFAWWKDALGQDFQIDSITIWNRTDCCRDRLNNFSVSVWNDGAPVWSAFYFQGAGPDPSVSFSVGAVGDTIIVQLTRQDYLHMAEVQVFGSAAVPEPGTWALMALGLAGVAGLTRRRSR